MFKLGSFGGTYWRPIYSGVNNREYKNVHKIPQIMVERNTRENLSSSNYDVKRINTR